jgi:hypothetical protein
MSSTDREMKLIKTLFQDEIDANGGVIPHGGKNDYQGAYLCDDCAKEKHEAFVTFWVIWHKENGYTMGQTAKWLAAINTRYGKAQ